MIPLLAVTEVVAGLMLLSGRFVPLGLTMLAPVIVNIVGFDLFLVHGGLGLAVVVVALELYLAWTYRDEFAPMLRMRNATRTVTVEEGDREECASRGALMCIRGAGETDRQVIPRLPDRIRCYPLFRSAA